MTNREPSSANVFGFYESPIVKSAVVQDYLCAEVSVAGRHHKRVIAAQTGQVECDGRVILYSDTYTASSEPQTFVYARHNCTPVGFFCKLNEFLSATIEDNSELRDREFPVLLSTNGKALIFAMPIPYSPSADVLEGTTFFRLDLPFGPITIEFGETRIPAGNQVVDMGRDGLTKELDGPLIAIDQTESNIYAPLFLSCHWASRLVPAEVLEVLLDEVTPSPIPA
jgi:hypothetical protein